MGVEGVKAGPCNCGIPIWYPSSTCIQALTWDGPPKLLDCYKQEATQLAEAAAGDMPACDEGVGNPFSYRKHSGIFTLAEWVVSIALPILIVILGMLLLSTAPLLALAVDVES